MSVIKIGWSTQISSLQAGEISPRVYALDLKRLFFRLCVLLLSDFIIQPPEEHQLLLFVVIPTAPLFYLPTHTHTHCLSSHLYASFLLHLFLFHSRAHLSTIIVVISYEKRQHSSSITTQQQKTQHFAQKQLFGKGKRARKKNVFLRAQLC